jgi:hypothetical protein
MELRFPKARLFAYDRILQGQPCSSVLINAVVDAGLIPEESLKTVSGENCQRDSCQSVCAAKHIIRAYMTERHQPPEASRLARSAFSSLKSDLKGWQLKRKETQPSISLNSCREHTPVILDLLLQQLMRH